MPRVVTADAVAATHAAGGGPSRLNRAPSCGNLEATQRERSRVPQTSRTRPVRTYSTGAVTTWLRRCCLAGIGLVTCLLGVRWAPWPGRHFLRQRSVPGQRCARRYRGRSGRVGPAHCLLSRIPAGSCIAEVTGKCCLPEATVLCTKSRSAFTRPCARVWRNGIGVSGVSIFQYPS